jgi:polysaccharide biosynthesis/export protein
MFEDVESLKLKFKKEKEKKMSRKKLMLILIILLIMKSGWTNAEEYVGRDGDYIIGFGDILDISNWKDESMTKSVVVLPDGKISFPLIGIFRAAGKTVAELKHEMETEIVKYVPDPLLNVEVKQVNSMKIYVIGRVNKSDQFNLNGEVTVLQALSMAGGLNQFANKDKIRIIRQNKDKQMVIPFKYNEVVENSAMEQNIKLQRGDVVVVP